MEHPMCKEPSHQKQTHRSCTQKLSRRACQTDRSSTHRSSPDGPGRQCSPAPINLHIEAPHRSSLEGPGRQCPPPPQKPTRRSFPEGDGSSLEGHTAQCPILTRLGSTVEGGPVAAELLHSTPASEERNGEPEEAPWHLSLPVNAKSIKGKGGCLNQWSSVFNQWASSV